MTLSLPLLLVLAAPLHADTPLVGEMSRLMNLFDSAPSSMPKFDAPTRGAFRRGAPVDAEAWAPAVGEAGPAKPGAPVDAFVDLEACAAADVVYIRQPGLEEAVAALTPCLEAVSKRYGAAAVIAPEGKGLLIRLPVTAADSALSRDLAQALKVRKGRLFGWPVSVRADLASVQSKGVSILQPVLERCAGPKLLPTDAESFVAAYGACLRQAKGLAIAEVRPHPSDPRTVVVYSGGRIETLMDMSGSVFVPAARGAGPFRIEARRALAADLLRRG